MHNAIIYNTIQGKIDPEILRGIIALYHTIFGIEKTEKVVQYCETMPTLLTLVAQIDDEIIGFKMGYAIDDTIFYSWLGGVDETYRGQNIAVTLMTLQHDWCRANGYKIVRTKTLNRWRNMLILNIKQGFEITETYTDERGVLKIVLEKKL
jgi:predicted GNAT superfamily acetyltransferase